MAADRDQAQIKPILTRMSTTSNFLIVLKRRKLILCLVFLFALTATLNAFAHCLVEHDLPPTHGSEGAGNISCLDTEIGPFLRPYNSGREMTSFAKMQKKSIAGGTVTLIKELPANPTSSDSPRSIFVPYSVPFYQLYTIYRI